MFRKTVVTAFALVAVVALGSAAPVPTAGAKSASDEPDFTGKVLAIAVADAKIQGAALQNAHIKHLGNRAFLVGDSIKRGPDDDEPPTVFWFPIEDVKLVREYKSVEDLMKDYARQERSAKRDN